MIRRPLSGLLAALVLLALLPLAARAADTVVDFEALSDDIEVYDEYAAAGVRFDSAPAFGMPAPPVRDCGGPNTTSGPPHISGRSAAISCRGTGEFDGAVNGAFGFDTERRAVRLSLQSNLSGDGVWVDVTIHAIGGRLLDSRAVFLPRSQTVNVAFGPRGAPDIAAVQIVSPTWSDAPVGGPVLIDDIVAPIDARLPPPKFSLALPRPSVDVYEGATAEVPVSVLRYNGSSGPVNVSVPALPPGITGTLITPNPVSGRDPATLRITAASPLSGERQVAVTAAAAPGAPVSVGTPVTTSAVVNVQALPALGIDGNVNPEIVVPRCSDTLSGVFNVRGNYFGTVHVTAQTVIGSTTPGAPSDMRVFGNGTVRFTHQFSSFGNGPAVVRITLTPDGATPVSAEYKTRIERVTVARWGNNTVPDDTRVVVARGNFPISCPLRFVDDAGRDYPVAARDFQDGQDVLTLNVPAGGAVSAPSGLRVLAPDGTLLDRTPPLRVDSFRNIYALRQANDAFGGGSRIFPWDDFVSTWGEDDAYACFIGCVRDPIAVDYWERWLARAKQYTGLCFGWSTMALRFRGIASSPLSPAAYERGALRAWDITNFGEGAQVKRDVTRYQYLQNDRTLNPTMGNPIRGPGSMAQRLAEWRQIAKNAIARDGGVMTVFFSGTSGHAVVAYRLVDLADGGFRLALADPNAPYQAMEETSIAAHDAAVAMNTITVKGDGTWTGSSFGWSGNLNQLGFVPYLPVLNARLPNDLSLASLFEGGTASIAAIGSGGAKALNADGTGREGSGVTVRPALDGAGAAPEYALARGRSYDVTVRGAGSGDYSFSGLGDGANAVLTGAGTRAGQEDHVTLTPGKAQLGFTPGGDSGAVGYSLVEAPSRDVRRTASIQTSGRRGTSDVAVLSGGELSLVHRGSPTTVAVTLGSLGSGLPGSVQLAPLRVGRGERIALKPSAWGDLSDGVSLVVRNARGRVVRRAKARIRATRVVRLTSLKARASGRTVTVGGRVGKRGTAPVLAVRVETLRGRRGGRVVARRTASLRGEQVKAGGFTLKVGVPRLSRGTLVRVSATLLDEAAELASTRRSVTVSARGR